jgi:hypothetical protein
VNGPHIPQPRPYLEPMEPWVGAAIAIMIPLDVVLVMLLAYFLA